MSRRSMTSEIAIVSEDAKAPSRAVMSCWVMSRWATVPAVVGVEVASATTRLIFAPPSSAIPPAVLISSATSSMPLRELTPNWAFGPDSGMMTPTLTGGASARAEERTKGAARNAAVPDSSIRRFTCAIANELAFNIAILPKFLGVNSWPQLAARQTRRLLPHRLCRKRLQSLTGNAVHIGRHSGMVRSTRPGISRFSDVQLHIVVRCFASPRNDEGRCHRTGTYSSHSGISHCSKNALWCGPTLPSAEQDNRSISKAWRGSEAFGGRFDAVHFDA